MPDHSDWERVGERLQQQRVTLDPRYRNRSLFSRERGINYRLAQDIETGARDNYELSTLTHIEIAYDLPTGSIRSMLRKPVLSADQQSGLDAILRAAQVWAEGEEARKAGNG